MVKLPDGVAKGIGSLSMDEVDQIIRVLDRIVDGSCLGQMPFRWVSWLTIIMVFSQANHPISDIDILSISYIY